MSAESWSMGRAAEAIHDIFAETGERPNFLRPKSDPVKRPYPCFHCGAVRPFPKMQRVEGLDGEWECRTLSTCEQRIVAIWAGVQG